MLHDLVHRLEEVTEFFYVPWDSLCVNMTFLGARAMHRNPGFWLARQQKIRDLPKNLHFEKYEISVSITKFYYWVYTKIKKYHF